MWVCVRFVTCEPKRGDQSLLKEYNSNSSFDLEIIHTSVDSMDNHMSSSYKELEESEGDQK